MDIPGLTETTIREHTEEGSFERGERYLEEGAVQHIDVSPGEVEAHVQGSETLPYTVSIQYGDEGITQVNCTCPYHEGSWCKHIVAVLLAHLRGAEERTLTLQALLSDMSRDELVALVERLADRDPRVKEWVQEEQVAPKTP